MGTATSKLREEANKKVDEDKQKALNKIEFLENVLKAKIESYKEEIITKKEGDKRIFGDNEVDYQNKITINISTEVSKEIDSAVDSFFDGDFKDGFKSLVKSSLNEAIGNTGVGENINKVYHIGFENNSIIRYDLFTYRFNFYSKGIVEDVENIFCYQFIKSVVDHKKVNIDTMIYLLTKYVKGTEKDPKKQLELVSNYVSKLKEIYKDLEN